MLVSIHVNRDGLRCKLTQSIMYEHTERVWEQRYGLRIGVGDSDCKAVHMYL